MGCNLKVASIVIATLAITFSSLTLVKLSVDKNPYEKHHCDDDKQQIIDHGGVIPPKEGEEPWRATPTTTSPPKTKRDEFTEKFHHHRTTRTERVIGIIVTIVSIVSSFMIFGAVSDDREYNQCRRHMILPFVVFHSLMTLLHAIAAVYVAITYRAYMESLWLPLLVYIALIFVTVIGISFVGAYYKSLSRMAGFSYAQMEDVQKPLENEVKVPLA